MSKGNQLDDGTAVEGAGVSGTSNSSGEDKRNFKIVAASFRDVALANLQDEKDQVDDQENNSCLSSCLSAPQACFNFLWASVSSSSESTSLDDAQEGLVSGENKNQETNTSSDVFDLQPLTN